MHHTTFLVSETPGVWHWNCMAEKSRSIPIYVNTFICVLFNERKGKRHFGHSSYWKSYIRLKECRFIPVVLGRLIVSLFVRTLGFSNSLWPKVRPRVRMVEHKRQGRRTLQEEGQQRTGSEEIRRRVYSEVVSPEGTRGIGFIVGGEG